MSNQVIFNSRTNDITVTRGGLDFPLRDGEPGRYIWYWTPWGETRQIFTRWAHGSACVHEATPHKTAWRLAWTLRLPLRTTDA